MSEPPRYDSDGINVLDPNDKLGHKSNYITTLHKLAIQRYFPDGKGGLAVDLGCGYGRLTSAIASKGWSTIGIDPSEELVEYADKTDTSCEYRVGGLPDLPVSLKSVDLMVMHNILKPLMLLGKLDVLAEFQRFLSDNSTVIVVENLKKDDPRYVEQSRICEIMQHAGLACTQVIPIRAARTLPLSLIRYGLIPQRFHKHIALKELNAMYSSNGLSRLQYWNVLMVFKRAAH